MVIGIDLGTTNSAAAVIEGGRAVMIPSAAGGRTTPSVVAFAKNGERIIGEPARRQAAANPTRTVFSIKRQMGTDIRVRVDDKKLSPQEISAMILMRLKKDAEEFTGEKITDAVITVPAYFNDAQRQATKDAGRIAGLNVKRIINEPTAAALAYGLDHGRPAKILVYDLGGVTFDVSVIEIGDGVIEVLSTAGDNRLGGDDFDLRLADFITREFRKENRIKIGKDYAAMQRIMDAAEECKKELSVVENYNLNIPFLAVNKKNEPVDLRMNITRKMFEEIIKDLIDKTAQPVLSALKDACLSPSDIDKVLLVGGSTRIPAVVEKVKNLIGVEPSTEIDPDECVAIGAAIQGERLGRETSPSNGPGDMADIVLMDVTPLSLSIETIGGVAHHIIERNMAIPTRQSQIFSTASNFQTSVDIKVYQGEKRLTRDNKLLGNFRLEGIKRAFAGVPQIEVAFEIDVNGILSVSAKDLGSGAMQNITITGSSNLSEEEIERACREAALYESSENRKKELEQIRKEAAGYIADTESWLDRKRKELECSKYKGIKAQKDHLKKIIAVNDEWGKESLPGEIREEYLKLRNMREG